MDNIFALFESGTQVELFKNLMNICRLKMKFTIKKEQNNCFNFLDIKIIREDKFLPTWFSINPLLVVLPAF